MALFRSSFTGYGNFLFKYRNMVFPAVLLLLLAGFKPGHGAGNGIYDIYLVMAGILIIISGQAVRAMVIGLAYIKRGGVNKKVHADDLVISGIFAHCRNPLYLGNLLIVLGLLIVHNNFWVYVLGLSFFLVSYSAIVMAEETYLQNKFGDLYTAYCEKTGRWSFNFHGLGRTFKDMHFNWRRVVLKDYTTMMTWTTTLGLLLIWRAVSFQGLKNAGDIITYSAVAIVLLLASGLYVRLLKKTGRLSEGN